MKTKSNMTVEEMTIEEAELKIEELKKFISYKEKKEEDETELPVGKQTVYRKNFKEPFSFIIEFPKRPCSYKCSCDVTHPSLQCDKLHFRSKVECLKYLIEDEFIKQTK